MRLVKDSPLAIGWVTFPVRPPVHTLVVVVKATFDLPEAGPCTLAETQELVTGDLYWDDDVERSVRWDSDLAITKPRAEWWLTGLFRPSRERVVTHAVLDVRVGAQGKRLAIVGDRWWRRGVMAGATAPLPIGEVPLSFDRAFGGAKHKENRWGLGMDPDPTDAERRVRLPNIEVVESPIASPSDRPRVASAFPIPRMHPARAALTGTYDASYMATRWPFYPADFQWSHFQAAPADQRVEGFFRGDETIEAEGLHPDRPRVRARLPGIVPRVFLQPVGVPIGNALTPVSLVLDTIVIDATGAKAFAVWRGHVEGVRETLEDVSHVFLVHEPLERPSPPSTYEAWFAHRLAEEDAEETAFEPEPAPSLEPRAAAERGGETPSAASLEEGATVPEPRLTPLSERRQELLDEGVPLDIVDELAPLGPPSPPPDPSIAARELEEAIEMARRLDEPELLARLEAARDVGQPPPAGEPPPWVEPRDPTPRESVEQQLARGESMAGAMLVEVDLSGLDFSRRDLSGTQFLRCNLRGCTFAGASLASAVLDGSVIDGASFAGASMPGAHLDHVSGEGVSFRGASLEDARAERASLPRADFVAARGARAELIACQLTQAVFDSAVLDGAELSGSELTRARFVEASLVDAWLDNGVVAQGAQFEAANLTLLRAYGSDFADANFKWARADKARFGASRLDRANFSFADLTKSDFAGASCVQTVFLSVNAPGAAFERATLVGAQLGRGNLLEASFLEANLHHADLRGANLFRAELYRARVEDARLELANLDGTKLEKR